MKRLEERIISIQKEVTALNPSAVTDGGQPQGYDPNNIIDKSSKNHNKKSLETINALELSKLDLPDIQFTINDILPKGIYILAGSPKVGKSWLALQACNAVTTEASFWRFGTHGGTVLYLALEDSLVRLKSRMHKQTDTYSKELHFATRSLSLQDGLLEQLQTFLTKHTDTSLIVIDTVQHIRNSGGDKNLYIKDYEDINQLRSIANSFPITIILVTHLRKMEDPDPLNMISGSTGLVGATDGSWILQKDSRESNNAKLIVTNRDTESFSFLLKFDVISCTWTLVNEEGYQEQEDKVLSHLGDWFSEKERWQGTATELYNLLVKSCDFEGHTPATLSRKIRTAQQELLNQYQIQCNFSTINNKRIVTLSKM